LTSERLVSLVLHVKDVLYALNPGKSNVIGRTNRAHTSEKSKECLKKSGVVLEFHESTTCSKKVMHGQDVCTSMFAPAKKIGKRDVLKNSDPKYIHQVLNESKKIIAVLLEQQDKTDNLLKVSQNCSAK
jgi:hypothetical protein